MGEVSLKSAEKYSDADYMVKHVKTRCSDTSDCWTWGQSMSRGQPTMRVINIIEGKKVYKTVNVRKYLKELLNGPTRDKNVVASSCGNLDCVSPAHAREWTRKALQKRTAKVTKYGESTERNLAISKARRKNAKLNLEIVKEIRAEHGTLSSRAAAKKYGVAQSTILSVWQNEIWRESANDNPWSGLLAA